MDNETNTTFQINSNNKNSINHKGNLLSNIIEEDKKESSYNENRISFKLSLRKQKIQELIFNKRGHLSQDQIFETDDNDIKIKENDIVSGIYYNSLEIAYKNNDNASLCKLLKGFAIFLDEIPKDNGGAKILLMKSNDTKNTNFPLCLFILQISINSTDKIVYLYSINLILNFSFISNEFCKEISNVDIMNKMIEKLLFFFPLFAEKKNLEEKNSKKIREEIAQAQYFGALIFKIFGNIFICSLTYKSFESINFYEKIFNLLYIFELDSKHKKYISIHLEYLDTLIWLIYLFIEKNKNFVINYNEKILMIIPCLIKNIRGFYYLKEKNLYLEKLVEIIERISDLNIIYAQKLVECDTIQILSNLFGYLFPSDMDMDTEQINLSDDVIDKILGIFVIIFTVDSKYIINLDFSSFALVIEKLLDIYKIDDGNKNYYYIRNKLVVLLSNLACFEDVQQIVTKFMKNQIIISTLFQYYYTENKLETLLFIDNVMTKQGKDVRDLVLNLGGFDIIKRNICENDGNDKKIILYSINALYKLIEAEKAFNIRLLFENIYNTAIPEKIKELFFDKDIQNENEQIIKLIITDFETYEKSFES